MVGHADVTGTTVDGASHFDRRPPPLRRPSHAVCSEARSRFHRSFACALLMSNLLATGRVGMSTEHDKHPRAGTVARAALLILRATAAHDTSPVPRTYALMPARVLMDETSIVDYLENLRKPASCRAFVDDRVTAISCEPIENEGLRAVQSHFAQYVRDLLITRHFDDRDLAPFGDSNILLRGLGETLIISGSELEYLLDAYLIPHSIDYQPVDSPEVAQGATHVLVIGHPLTDVRFEGQ